MDTSLTDDTPAGHPLVLRLLVVAGALFGFTLLAMAVSGAAEASEGGPPQDQPGLLDRFEGTVHGVLKPVGPAVKPVTGTVHSVTSQVASTVTPGTRGLERSLAPLTCPVSHAAEPVLSALRPVTEPVLRATSPVLHAVAPVTEPVVRAIGAERVVAAVTGQPAKPAPRGDVTTPPAAGIPGEQTVSDTRPGPGVLTRSAAQRRPDARIGSRHGAGEASSDAAGIAGPMSGAGGGGLPADVSAMSGATFVGAGGQHGGEYAVTASGSVMPGTDRLWRAPPAGAWPLYWLKYYGNDHPS
ncbi:hypothetical protein AB5J62_13105 [Amycolatopsis sp. cg5]|uniref:hypothetical protein n=1 Tax=Amycolatopsis sp. cg5 TaxID=3238802 RepID=UPI0035245A58